MGVVSSDMALRALQRPVLERLCATSASMPDGFALLASLRRLRSTKGTQDGVTGPR